MAAISCLSSSWNGKDCALKRAVTKNSINLIPLITFDMCLKYLICDTPWYWCTILIQRLWWHGKGAFFDWSNAHSKCNQVSTRLALQHMETDKFNQKELCSALNDMIKSIAHSREIMLYRLHFSYSWFSLWPLFVAFKLEASCNRHSKEGLKEGGGRGPWQGVLAPNKIITLQILSKK